VVLLKVIVAVVSVLVLCPLTEASSVATHSVDRLSWLAGCWAIAGGEEGSGEQWTMPAGGTMLGVSRSVNESQTTAYEFLLIRETKEGTIEYVARPSGQAGATFVMVGRSDREVAFENPQHDFPQRISYSLKGEGKLETAIEGMIDGELKTVKFPFRRVGCGGPGLSVK